MNTTYQHITRYNWTFLEVAADKFGGDVTMNELRVALAIQSAHVSGLTASVSSIVSKTSIPQSTVSYAVRSLVEKGFVREERDTEDGRKWHLKPSDKMLARVPADMDVLAAVFYESTNDTALRRTA